MATPTVVPWNVGHYLTNGLQLFQVIETKGREVLLEDVYTGKREWCGYKKLLCDMRVVKPKGTSAERPKTQASA